MPWPWHPILQILYYVGCPCTLHLYFPGQLSDISSSLNFFIIKIRFYLAAGVSGTVVVPAAVAAAVSARTSSSVFCATRDVAIVRTIDFLGSSNSTLSNDNSPTFTPS